MNNRGGIVALVLSLLFLVGSPALRAQQTCQARMEQDPTLNNLVHAEGYQAAEPGALGRVTRVGNGPRHLVLIAGAGFGGEIFASFMEANRERYTMIAITLPGFGGTAAPPMPPGKTSYGDQTWTRAAQHAVARRIEEEKLERPVVLGHWLNATQIALGLALERPDLVRAAIVVSGVPRFVPTGGSPVPEPKTPQQRAIMVDQYLAPNWFKTVTRATWDDNNFLPRDYAVHPLRALQLWQEAARPTLPVWIRYLCEAWAGDSNRDLARLEVPVLILEPKFDALYFEGPQMGDYMEAFLHRGWDGAAQQSDLITLQTIADSRVFVMDDQPAKLNESIARFVDRVGSGTRRPRPASPDGPRIEGAPTMQTPDFWGGTVERRDDRYTLVDAGVSIERPRDDWDLQAEVDKAPVVARMWDPLKKAQTLIQIQSDFGMTLDALVAMIESRYAAQFPKFRKLSSAETTLDGRAALQLDCVYERNGEMEQGRLIVTKLVDDFVLSVTFRASPEEFAGFQAQFAGIAGSVKLKRRE